MATEIKARMTLNNSGFISGLKQSTNEIEGFKSKLKGIGAAVSAALSLDFVGDQMKKLVDRATEIRDKSTEIGVDTQTFQKLQFFLEQSSGDVNKLRTGFVQLAKAKDDALSGNPQYLASFEKLGITFDQLKNGKLEDLFATISTTLRNTDTQSVIAPLSDLLGARSAATLIPALRTDLKAMFDEAESRGTLISDDEIQKISALGDQLLTLKRQLQSLAVDVGGPIISATTAAVKGLQDVLQPLLQYTGTRVTAADAFREQLRLRQGVSGEDSVVTTQAPIDQSRKRTDSIIVEIVKRQIGDQDLDRVRKTAEIIREALGEKIDTIELDDEGLIRSNKELESALTSAIANLNKSEISKAELDIATKGRSLGTVIEDQRKDTDATSRRIGTALVPDELRDELSQNFDLGKLDPLTFLFDKASEAIESSFARSNEIRSKSDNNSLIKGFGNVDVPEIDTSNVESGLLDLVNKIDAQIQELQTIAAVNKQSKDSVTPKASELFALRDKSIASLELIQSERAKGNEDILRSLEASRVSTLETQSKPNLSGGEFASRTDRIIIDRIEIAIDEAAGKVINDANDESNFRFVKRRSDAARQAFGIPENDERQKIITRPQEIQSVRVVIAEPEPQQRRQEQAPEATEAPDEQPEAPRNRRELLKSSRIRQIIETVDETQEIPAPDDSVATQTVVTDDETQEIQPAQGVTVTEVLVTDDQTRDIEPQPDSVATQTVVTDDQTQQIQGQDDSTVSQTVVTDDRTQDVQPPQDSQSAQVVSTDDQTSDVEQIADSVAVQTVVTNDQTQPISAPIDSQATQTVITDDQTQEIQPAQDVTVTEVVVTDDQTEDVEPQPDSVATQTVITDDQTVDVPTPPNTISRQVVVKTVDQRIEPAPQGDAIPESDAQRVTQIPQTRQTDQRSVETTEQTINNVTDIEAPADQEIQPQPQPKIPSVNVKVEVPKPEIVQQSPDSSPATDQEKPEEKSDEQKTAESIIAGLNKALNSATQSKKTKFEVNQDVPDLQRLGLFQRGFVENNPGTDAIAQQLEEAKKHTALLTQHNRLLEHIRSRNTVIQR